VCNSEQNTPEAGTSRPPLVIVNGLGAPKVAAQAYGNWFEGRGWKTSVAPQTLLARGDVRNAAAMLHEHVLGVLRESGASKVALVGMSLGGLIGLYYIKCGAGAQHVARFVSVGGPLNGSDTARLARAVPKALVPALAQVQRDSELIGRVKAAPMPEGVSVVSMGTRGDVMTPRSAWEIEGATNIETPHGVFPFGHWTLFTHPGNLRAVLQALEG